MYEAAEERDRETPTDPEADPGLAVRVEPDATMVSWHAEVPPDAPEEMPVSFRPLAAVRSVAGRFRRLVSREGGRQRRGRRN